MGYNIETFGQKSYNGVAILSNYRIEEFTSGIPGLEHDHSRYIEAVMAAPGGPVRVESIYAPNGNPIGTEKFQFKLHFMEALRAHLLELLKLEERFVISFFSSRRRHTRLTCDWSSDVCSSDLIARFCGEIIFPTTPPELFDAASSSGSMSAFLPAVTCSRPKSEFDEVSEPVTAVPRSEEHTSELQSHVKLVCRLLLEKKKTTEAPALEPPGSGRHWGRDGPQAPLRADGRVCPHRSRTASFTRGEPGTGQAAERADAQG